MEFFELVSIIERAFVTDVYKRYFWAYFVIGGCLFAVVYIFQAIALYTIATREGFKNKWMAFLPFFNTYYIGVVSEKNKVFRVKAKYVSLAAALLEVAYCALAVLYYVAVHIIFSGGYAQPVYETMIYGTQIEMLAGYNLDLLPANLSWAGWVFGYMQDYVVFFVQAAYLILKVFILISFFRTYASPRYLLFAIFSALLPIGGVFMFAVRNNRGKSYAEFIREQQQRQYRMYQEYMRNHGADGQGGNYGQNYGSDYGGQNNNPYAQPRPSAPPEDPFGGLGSSNGGSRGESGGKSSDPFDDFKN